MCVAINTLQFKTNDQISIIICGSLCLARTTILKGQADWAYSGSDNAS